MFSAVRLPRRTRDSACQHVAAPSFEGEGMRADAHQKIKTNPPETDCLSLHPAVHVAPGVRKCREHPAAVCVAPACHRSGLAAGTDRCHRFGFGPIGGFGGGSRRLSASGYGGQSRTCWYRARAGSIETCTKLDGLAPIARDLCVIRYADPG